MRSTATGTWSRVGQQWGKDDGQDRDRSIGTHGFGNCARACAGQPRIPTIACSSWSATAHRSRSRNLDAVARRLTAVSSRTWGRCLGGDGGDLKAGTAASRGRRWMRLGEGRARTWAVWATPRRALAEWELAGRAGGRRFAAARMYGIETAEGGRDTGALGGSPSGWRGAVIVAVAARAGRSGHGMIWTHRCGQHVSHRLAVGCGMAK